jgi:hypothetical protein
MNKLIHYVKIILIIPLAFAIATYASTISQELLDDYYFGAPRVLVDSSRDGGLWWAPQPFSPGVFDPDLAHQGKALADYLKSLGMEVDELPRPTPITAGLLNDYHLVVRPGAFTYSGYSEDEIAAYSQYVAAGGALILLADGIPDFDPPLEPDLVALHFGLDFQGKVWGWIDSFTDHPITTGIESIYYPAGSVLFEDPPPYTIELGFIDGQGAMGILPFGFGQVFFMGDTREVVFAQQPLTGNLFVYFLTIEGLMSQVLVADLDAHSESGLLKKLEAAQKSRDDDRFKPMQNQLRGFIKKVEALVRSGRMNPVLADPLIGAALTLISIDRTVDEPACPCWTVEDISSLPIPGTDAVCQTEGSRLGILQEGICEHSYGVDMGPGGSLSCVTNRFDCPGLPDLGGFSIETTEDEFLTCLDQIRNRCEELGIDPPDFP